MKRILKKLVIVLVTIVVLATIGIIYLLYNDFSVPKIIKNRISDFTKSYYGLDFDYNNLIISFPSNKITIGSFSLSVADKPSFISISSGSIEIASTTALFGLFSDKIIVNKIIVNNLYYDLMAPQLEEASGTFKLPSIPAQEIFLNGITVNSKYGKFDLSENTAYINKNGFDVKLNFDIPKGPFGISTFFKSNINLSDKIASISLQIQQNSIADCLPIELYASEYNINIDNGIFNLDLHYFGNIEERINNPLKNIAKLLNEELSGVVSIKKSAVRYKDIDFNGNLIFSKLASDTWNFSIKGLLANGNVDINGKWLGTDDNLTNLDCFFNLNNIKLQKELLLKNGFPSINFEPGLLAFNGNLKGDIASFSGNGKFSANNWFFINKKLNDINLNWQLSNDLSLRNNGIIDTFLGKINASSTIWLSGENKFKGILEGNLNKIQLKEIGNLFNVPLEGTCDAPFLIELDILNPLKSVYSLDLSLNNVSAFDFKTKFIEGNISGTGLDWKISNPHLLLKNSGEIIVDGYIASSSLNTKVKVINADLNNFGLEETIIKGYANLEANLNGLLKNPNLYGTLFGNDIIVMGIPLNSFKSEVKIINHILSLNPIVIKPVDGSIVDGYFSIDLKDAKIQNARINFQQLCIELFKPFLPKPLLSEKLNGVFGGYITYSRLKNDNFVKVLIDGRDLILLGQELDSLYVEAESLGRQAELKSLYLKGLGGSINLTGHINNAQKFSGSLKGDNLKFNRMEFLKKYLPDFQGNLDFQGDIDWDGKKRKGNFVVFARNLETDERELGNYGGEIIIDDDKLEIKNGEFDKLGIKLKGDLKWAGKQPYELELDFNNVDLSFVPQAHDLTLFENGSLIVDGKCNIKGDLASLTPNFANILIDKLRIQKDEDVIVNNKTINIDYKNKCINLDSIELKYKLGILSINGQIPLNKDINIKINGDNFSAKALGHLFGIRNINYDGDVLLNASILGKLDDIKFNSQTEINNLNIEGFEIPKVQAKVEGDKSKLNIKETFVKLKNTSFNLKGDVLLNNFIPQKCDLSLVIPEGPISDLEVYLPKIIKQADGNIKGKLNIIGNPINPEITGDLHINGNKIQLTSMKKPFTNIVFDMTTNDMITTVNTLKASMGKGLIKGYGNVDFKNASGSLDVHLNAEKLDLPFLSLEIFNASGALDLTGDIYNPVINSKIFIPRGKLGLNANLFPEKTESKPIFNSLKYNIEVVVPKNFWVKNAFLNSELKGKCIVSGDLENFKIEGGVSTIQGKIFFKQRQFKIQNGEIKFGGVDNSLDPYIFVKSEGQVQSTKIYLTLQGNLSNFKPQVYSTPPMSEGDIIALLTLGRNLTDVSNSDTKDLFEDEVLEGLKNSYISSLIGDSISNALNLDELYLTSAFDKKTGKSQSYVRIGKYLSDKIFMAYEGTMSDDKDESYIFEYRLPKGFVFSIEFEQPENNQNYGIRYDWKF